VGITQAWAASFDAILHNDIASVNQRVADECRAHGEGLLRPVGSVNLSLPNWEEDVRRCRELHGMQILRLLPGYHDFTLEDARFRRLTEIAREAKLILQIVVRLEDPRTQHRMLSVKDVDLKPLQAVVAEHPASVFVLLNALSSSNAELHAKLAATGRVYFDLATLEGMAGLERLIKHLPAERILFGTHSPFFVTESAALKLKESAIPAPMRSQIQHLNAELLLASH
jgi:hypothetical protein